MTEKSDVPSGGLVVTDVRPFMELYLIDQTKEVLKRQRRAMTPEMFCFGRVYQNQLRERDYRDYATRLNDLIAKLDGYKEYPCGESCAAYLNISPGDKPGIEGMSDRPCVEAALSVPMSIPFAPRPKVMVMTYLFVYDLVPWKWSLDGYIADTTRARERLIELVGSLFIPCREGEIPTNSEDYTK